MAQILPVILCGGSGTRLWPLSREHFPKQFISLMGQATLFQQTLQRLEGLDHVLPPVILGNEEHRFLAREQLHQIHWQAKVFILEPEGRNTAPALTLASLWAEQQSDVDSETYLLVMPSDHVILQPRAFRQAITDALALAQTGKIVTFGVQPSHAETGYGYIQARGSEIVAFKEKPDLATAQAYLEQGAYLWNAGLFLCSPEVWLRELQEYAPEILQACREAMVQGQADQSFFRPQTEAFQASPAISIDYAVMERTQAAAVVPLDAGWSDVGSWSALKAVGEADAANNIVEGDVLTWQSHNNYIKSTTRLVAALGVEDLIVVETPDAVLVANQERAQEVRHIVDHLHHQKRPEAQDHLKVARPWGYFESVDRGDGFQVKRITVHPHQALSLQSHHHRSEHWVVVQGTARVTRGEEVFLLHENQSTYIPQGTRHRLENPGVIDLQLIEIQSGSYLGEDDIIRYEDRYQRS